MGALYEMDFCDCWNLYALLDGSLLYGDSHNRNKFVTVFTDSEITEDPEVIFQNDESCLIVPGHRLGLGISYESNVCNCSVIFKLGYEFGAWYNVQNDRTYVEGFSFIPPENFVTENIALSNEGNSRTFGYHGLTIGVAVGF